MLLSEIGLNLYNHDDGEGDARLLEKEIREVEEED